MPSFVICKDVKGAKKFYVGLAPSIRNSRVSVPVWSKIAADAQIWGTPELAATFKMDRRLPGSIISQ